MTDFVQTVEQSILSRRLLRRGQGVLVAVSGGLDSMVLLLVLHRLARVHGWKLVVAHFNHRLRGRSSDADERLVKAAAKRLKLPCVVEGGDVRAFAKAHAVSLEMAARRLRHGFLAGAACDRGIRSIALAHHADDQVELFFLRLLRGAGADGLAGMKWSNPSPEDGRLMLIRPLLDQSKSALREFARAEGIPFRHDASNDSPGIRRNRIRHELLPLLARQYQPALAQVILRQMETLRADADLVDQCARDWLHNKDSASFEKLPCALQRRCLQLQLFNLGITPDFDLIEHLRREAGRPIAISPEQMVSRDARGVVISPAASSIGFDGGSVSVDLSAPTGNVDFAGTTIHWRASKQVVSRRPDRAPHREWFDADKVGPLVLLRHWCRGDRFQPTGMSKAVKLQDLFTNAKIPRAQRHRCVVAATAAGEVFWVEGLRISERFKLDKRTVRRLKWQWRRGG